MGWDGIYSYFFKHPLAVKQKFCPVKIELLPELLCKYRKYSLADTWIHLGSIEK